MRYIATSRYTLTGNIITDVVHADSIDEAWEIVKGYGNRHIDEVKETEWNGLTEFKGNSYKGKSPINIHQYNPD